MIATTTSEASGQESVTWFTHMLKNYIGFGFLEGYVSYMAYPLWLLVPFILCNAVYLGVFCSLYICSFLFYIYKKKNNIQEDTTSKLWDNAKQIIANFMDTVGKIWHGNGITLLNACLQAAMDRMRDNTLKINPNKVEVLIVRYCNLGNMIELPVLDGVTLSQKDHDTMTSFPSHVLLFVNKSTWSLTAGYEVIGMEHLPEGPGLIVYYHGALVLDYSLLVARVYMQKGRHIQSLVDNGLYIFPGTKLALDLTGCTNGNKSKCVEILKKGNLLGISPGGLREGNFSDHQNYNLIWGNRTGFAQVALEAKVPIIPMFSQNIREALRTVGKTWWLRWLYDNYMRILVLPIYGGFPVKLRTYLGEPIPYDPNITATELAGKTKIAIENLRDRYQKKPGNILRALSERFDKHHKDN